jgi:predicted nucleotidyltransferase component of viral defense system
LNKKEIQLSTWIEAGKDNPQEHQRRQIIEIVLTAIGSSKELQSILFLKGGALLNIAYQSPRATVDVDFTTTERPDGFAEFLKAKLDTEMRLAAVRLGYPELLCRIQSWEMRPPLDNEHATRPTLRVKIGHAKEGTHQAKQLELRIAAEVLRLDISFNEPIINSEEIFLIEENVSIQSYGYYEVVAEKLRAIVGQAVRNRQRGQDIFDVARLIRTMNPTQADKISILSILLMKALAQQLEVSKDSMSDPKIKIMAKSRYENLILELDSEELDFENDFLVVQDFYRSLPWNQ